MWNKFKEDEEVLKYFPDYSEAQIPEKKFLIDILSTIKYEYMQKIIKTSHTARSLKDDIESGDFIEIKKDLFNDIMNWEFNSSK